MKHIKLLHTGLEPENYHLEHSCKVQADCYADLFTIHFLPGTYGGGIEIFALTAKKDSDCDLEDVAERWLEKVQAALEEHIEEERQEFEFSGDFSTLDVGFY